MGLDECYRVPRPEELGFCKENQSPWRGGEIAGLHRLEEHLKNQVSLLPVISSLSVAFAGRRIVNDPSDVLDKRSLNTIRATVFSLM